MTTTTPRGKYAIWFTLAMVAVSVGVLVYQLFLVYVPTVFGRDTVRAVRAIESTAYQDTGEEQRFDMEFLDWDGGELLLTADRAETGAVTRCSVRGADGSWETVRLTYAREYGDLVWRGTPQVPAPGELHCADEERARIRVYSEDVERAGEVLSRGWTWQVGFLVFLPLLAAVLAHVVAGALSRRRGAD
ncbi:hypothetical protein [Actinoalloteichus spitiensis]|uniref:hypothetical protein n=1 Tax=Actinoalloteichus spitiensis TaxID=252394 RepID=UPI0003806544|nr:hypothetical protein [Actinoalloteichus spitiensis]